MPILSVKKYIYCAHGDPAFWRHIYDVKDNNTLIIDVELLSGVNDGGRNDYYTEVRY